VPDHLKDANRDREALGHGEGYDYPHEFPDHHIGQQYLPRDLLGKYFYRPTDQGYESEVGERLERWRKAQQRALGIEVTSELPDLSETQVDEIKRHHTRGNI
jgi:putative ATPase